MSADLHPGSKCFVGFVRTGDASSKKRRQHSPGERGISTREPLPSGRWAQQRVDEIKRVLNQAIDTVRAEQEPQPVGRPAERALVGV